MEQMMGEFLKVLIATIVSGVVLYIGIVNKLRSQISVHEEKIKQLETNCKEAQKRFEDILKLMTVLEEKAKRLEQRQDSHSKKNDEVTNIITELRLEITKQFGTMNASIGKIASDVENINSTIAIFDDSIVSRKKKNKK